jgi:hypothetical protein
MTDTGTVLQTDTLVIHACFADRVVLLWGESADAVRAAEGATGAIVPDAGASAHAFAVDAARLASAIGGEPGAPRSVRLRLPADGETGRALPSESLAFETGLDTDAVTGPVAGEETDGPGLVLGEFEIEALAVPFDRYRAVFDALLDRAENGGGDRVVFGETVEFYATLGVMAHHLLAQQRFLPMLYQDRSDLTGGWMAWLGDEATKQRVLALAGLMPPAARAAIDDTEHDAWAIIQSVLDGFVDAACRATLTREEMTDTIDGRDPSDVQIAWLSGLLGEEHAVSAGEPTRSEMTRRIRRWVGALEEQGQSTTWRLLLRLNEPLEESLEGVDGPPPDSVRWSLSLHLRNTENEHVVVDAVDIWSFGRDSVIVEGLQLDSPPELLLAELGRASRYCPPLERALDEAEPIEVMLETKEAYTFLREIKPILLESGFSVETPEWWDSPVGRLGARLRIESEDMDFQDPAGSPDGAAPKMGLTSLVGYHWDIAVGGTTLSLHEFEQLASQKQPLVRIDGRWVEIRPEDVEAAVEFIRTNPGGEMALGEALRMAFGADAKKIGLHVLGVEATGWVSSVLGGGKDAAGNPIRTTLPEIEAPENFQGTLRPYQARGLSWMAFLEQFGFGCCLADDMGLGKTVQLLALLTHERKVAREQGGTVKPTLLVVPMSVVGNWLKEANRFAPELKVIVHHGLERKQGDELVEAATAHDCVITTFALANRDRETLDRVRWGRLVVDEAQFIKNPAAKQSVAIRSLNADRRIALTGTPVENRLSELWSIMEFLNPGFLGTSGEFRKRFSQPIERYRDQTRSEQLRGLVRPFILRRTKTDPMIAADLPEKIETREYTHLTSEQAELYENCVNRMLHAVEESEGIHRRGLVLAALIKLKQICNHPAQMLKEPVGEGGTAPNPARSGKCTRLMEMVDEVLARASAA